jgi:hypothetical protein
VATSTTSGSASSSGAATSVVGGIQAVPVTEDPTQPISFAAWAPSGFSPSLSYHIAATGGPNTTIAAVETVTVTTLSQTVTATVTVGFVLDPTQIVQIAGNDGYDGKRMCASCSMRHPSHVHFCRLYLLQDCQRDKWRLH